jgi:[ribosomal protein S5]-alanine N-acetyltransferase
MQTRTELDQLFHPLPTLETARLRLEPIRVAHAEALFEVFSDPEVMRCGPFEPDANVEATKTRIGELLKRHETRTGISWALVLKTDERPVGVCILHSISWANRRGDLGFDLSSRLWRQGLMSEALDAIAKFSFSRLRFVKLVAQNTVENLACEALLLNIGFKLEGHLRSHGFWKGAAHDIRSYGFIAEN